MPPPANRRRRTRSPSTSCVRACCRRSESGPMIQETANRIATDVATGNQTACAACRMVYVICGTDEDGVEKLKKLGRLTYDAMLRLPQALTTKPKRYDPELRRQVDTLRLSDDFYTVIGGRNDEGAVLVSHSPD